MKRKTSRIRKTRKYKKRGGSSMEIVYPTFSANNQEVSEKNSSSTPIIKLYPLHYSALIMYDPDAPDSKPLSYLHYLVINIKNGDIRSGDVIVPYAGPTPPPGTGSHRYIFEQLEQSSPFRIAQPERSNFDTTQFKKQNNLALKATKMYRVTA
jgi:hypothetical protein